MTVLVPLFVPFAELPLEAPFPVNILVEQGKHASCPDGNGDGISLLATMSTGESTTLGAYETPSDRAFSSRAATNLLKGTEAIRSHHNFVSMFAQCRGQELPPSPSCPRRAGP